MRKHHKYTQEMKDYLRKVYDEDQAGYVEIRQRFEAKFGFIPSNGTVAKYGGLKQYKRKKKHKWSPAAKERLRERRALMMPAPTEPIKYCPYCGHNLKGVI